MLGVGLGVGSGPGIGVSDGIGYYCFSFVGLWACDFGSLMGLVDNTFSLLVLGLGWNWGSWWPDGGGSAPTSLKCLS